MLENTRLGFIGCGAMATAIISGLCEQALVKPEQITVSDPVQAQLDKLAQQYPIGTTQDNRLAIAQADIVVLAIKPQMLVKVATNLAGQLPAEALLISILAGSTIKTLSETLRHNRVVRVMPNTPAQINEGLSVWTCTDTVSSPQRSQAQAILGALGDEIFVDSEDYLDMATALSGGGPAYVFLFMEALVDAAVHMGFARPIAERIVFQTVAGSTAYARRDGSHLAELRNRVTSPGGTTAEALYQLEKGGFRATISKAIWSAYQKSRYLGGLDK